MSDERMRSWLGPLGLGFLVTIVLGLAVISPHNQPGQNASGADAVAFFRNNGTLAWAGFYLVADFDKRLRAGVQVGVEDPVGDGPVVQRFARSVLGIGIGRAGTFITPAEAARRQCRASWARHDMCHDPEGDR